LRGDSRIGQLSRIVPGLLAAALMAAPVFPASAAASSTSAAQIGVGQPRTVNVRRLPKVKPGTHPRVTLPYLTRNTAAYQAAKARAQAVMPSPRSRAVPPHTAANLPPAGTLQSIGFPGMGFEQQIAAVGADQALEPPDPQVAAGPDTVVETTNDTMSIWTKTGSRLWDSIEGVVDLNLFFPQIKAGYFLTDPAILYDTSSRRFFLTALAFDASLRSQLLAAVSVNGDPFGTWVTYDVTPVAATAGRLLDQPRLGTSDDKVVVAFDDYQGCTPCNFVDDGIVVLAKQAMTNGLSLINKVGFFQVTNSFGILPVRPMSSNSTAFTVENENLDPGTANAIGVRSITGDPNTPSTLMLFVATSIPLARPWFQPPNAAQPGTDALLHTGDGRIISANWRQGTLWVGLADGCFPVANPPSPPAPSGACLRLIQIGTPGSNPPAQDLEIGSSGDYLYYPAVATDAAGSLVTAYTHSSSTTFPTVEASGQLHNSPGTQPTNTIVVGAGSAAYDSRACGEANRWGDYSGAAMDPADPSVVWVAGEYAANVNDTCDWRTAFGRVVFSATSPVGPVYTFAPSPIARSGSLGPSATVSVSLGVRGADSANIRTVWLSFVPATGGGTAMAGGKSLNSTPQSFTTDSSGQVTVTYQTGAGPPANGFDVITVADQQSGSDVTAIDAYSYAGCPTTLTLTPVPIAPRGSLTARQSVAVVATPKDASSALMAGTPIRLSISGTGGGTAYAGPLAIPLTSTPTPFNTDSTGRLVITYATPGTLPTSGGTDTIAAQTDAACATQIAGLSSYTYAVPTTFYFAEGFTGTGFDESLSMLMPQQNGLAQVDFFTQSGTFRTFAPITQGLVTILAVNRVLGPNQQVSATVTLPGPGVVERVMHFDNGTWHGSTDEVGVNQPAMEWDFAEGSTLKFFNEFLSIQNPQPAPATVTLNYATDVGAHPVKTLTVPANTRVTVAVYVGDLNSTTSCQPLVDCGVGPGIVGVSVQVQASTPIVVERPMYVMNYSFGSGPIRDGHDAFGANAAGTKWDFAEGTTLAGFNEYLTLQNPGTSAASVTLTYLYDSGVKTVSLVVQGRSRETAIVNDPAHFGLGAGFVGVSTQVISDQPIVAERPMYIYRDFGTGPVAGAHDVVGATNPGVLFGFAQASTLTSENDYLSIENPNTTPAAVTITYFLDTGTVSKPPLSIAPTSRYTVQIFSSTDGVGPNQDPIGIVVSADQPVLVEKPTYGSNAASYGATDTMGYAPPAGF
jgi:hypothetical protein